MPYQTGQQIGSYVLHELLGRGGSGEVWLAERADGNFQQTVAIKLMQGFRHSKEDSRRFNRERQILAGLNHSGIARLLDGGRDESRRHYYVMEYVDGIPIVDFALQNQLPVEKRLALFRQACKAVQHAHRKLIIHSDLKPDHILVDEAGHVKLLDFGLARLAEQSDASSPVMHLFSPAYASPEQVSGKLLTTSTDVYSLGVVLYELLTGNRPYDLQDKTELQALKVVEEEIPRKPSLIDDKISDELDLICLKALEKDPEERYASVEAFSQDLYRYQNGLAITAKPKSAVYILRKFFQRNAIFSSLALFTLLAVTAVITVYTLQLRTEQQEAIAQLQRAKSLNSFFQGLFNYKDPRGDLTTGISAKELVDIGAGRIEVELHDQPGEKALLMRTIGRVYYRLGFREQEIEFQQKGMNLAEIAFDRKSLEFIESRRALAEAMSHNEKNAVAESLLTLALHTAEDKSREEYHVQQHSAILNDLGVMKRRLGKDVEAIPYMEEALSMGRQEQDTVQVLTSLNHLAILYRKTNKLAEAQNIYTDLIPLVKQQFGDDHPNTASCLNSAGRLYLEMERYAEAKKFLEESLEIREKIYGDSHPRLRSVLNYLATMHSAKGEFELAVGLRKRATEISRQSYGETHRYVLSNLKKIAEDQKSLGLHKEARATLDELEYLRTVNGER